MIVALAGAIALIFGRSTLRRYAFPIGFLVFMIPLPVALYTMLANPLQLIVSRVASGVMTTAGIPVLCEGNMMTLPGDIRMFVAEACSGMRQLTGFLALTAAVAYLSGKPNWYRVVLVASAIPVAMVANIARVIVTGLVMYYVDPNYAQGAWHTAEGMALMLGGLALLQLEMTVLNALSDVVSGGKPQSKSTTETTGADNRRGVVHGAQA
jgi:exosortase